MGRCYEFGVAIATDCEHAMHVVAEGGRCECPTCGVACDGRFSGCAAIVSVPGYVPAGAPTFFPPASEAPLEPEPPRPATVEDFDALRAETQAVVDEMRQIVDAALDAMATANEARPITATQLNGLRRRLARLGRSGQEMPD